MDYVDTLKALKLRYDQMHERPDGGTESDVDMAAAANGGGDAGTSGGGGALRGRTFAFTAGGDPIPAAAAASAPGRRRRGDERGLDRDEEDYFSSAADVRELSP